jgi:hypothetical protein
MIRLIGETRRTTKKRTAPNRFPEDFSKQLKRDLVTIPRRYDLHHIQLKIDWGKRLYAVIFRCKFADKHHYVRFPISRYGNLENAIKAAIAYRDQFFKENHITLSESNHTPHASLAKGTAHEPAHV